MGAGLALILLQGFVFWLAFKAAPASPEVERLALIYLSIRIWGAPATIALYAITGWLVGHGRTAGMMVIQLWMNGLNIALDLWFVLGLGWGIEGVAIATLIAEWTGLGLGLWLCREGLSAQALRDRARIFGRAQLARMARVNGDIMLRSVLLQGAFTSFVFLGARFGDVTLAANQVLLQFLEITAYALDGFAFAAEALVGQAVGAGSARQVRRAAVLTSQWGAAAALVLGLAFWFLGPMLVDLMTTEPQVRQAARGWLFWVALSPVLGITCWMLDGIFIGATRTRDMRIATIETMLVYAPALALLPLAFGNHGLWAALQVMFILRAITLGRRYPAIERMIAV